MRDFSKRAAVFIAIQLAILAIAMGFYRTDENAFLASYLDKHARLATAAAPRLVLVGGSNVAFSTDSELLLRELGVAPVNLGLQGSLGLRFMLLEALDGSRRGDTVVLAPEYAHYLARADEPLTLINLLEHAPDARKYIDVDWFLFKAFMDKGHIWLRGVLRSEVNRAFDVGVVRAQAPYSRDSVNAYGDVVAHWTMRAPGFTLGSVEADERPDPEIVDEIARFADDCRERGVRVFLFHPPIPVTKFDAMKPTIRAIQKALDDTRRIVALNRIDEMRYPDELFFDSGYHLTRTGGERRTRLLVDRLRAQGAANPGR
jgi:hypothetical protein